MLIVDYFYRIRSERKLCGARGRIAAMLLQGSILPVLVYFTIYFNSISTNSTPVVPVLRMARVTPASCQKY
jgi:hypothetical protein